MTRILLVGDIHAADRPPSSVNEGYLEDIIEILLHVAKLQKELGADATVWAGDVFNHKQPGRTSHATVMKMMDVVKAHEGKLYIIDGNHDISNDMLSSVMEKQPLGVLYKGGAHRLDGWHPELPLFGVPWQQRWLHQDTPWEAFELWRSAGGLEDGHNVGVDLSMSLAVTHAPIYPPATRDEQMFELVPTAGAHGLSEAMGQRGYLYYGHIHEDHGIYEDEGVTYANVGAISRGSLHEYNLNREIKAAFWTDENVYGVYPDGGDYQFEVGFNEIVLPHRPASEVFKIEQAQAAKVEKLNLDKFLSDVGQTSLIISSTESVVAHIRDRPDIEAPVKATAIEILEEVG